MSCPFLVSDMHLRCLAGLTAYVPAEPEIRATCLNEPGERYRQCRRYRDSVWSGLTPTVPERLRREEKR